MKITSEQRQKLEEAARKHNLLFILMHGSYATDKNREGSDLDIAYFPKNTLSSDNQMNLYEDLADIFGDNPDRELDVKSLSRTDPLFKHETMKKSIFLAGDRDKYDEFKIHAFREYMDSEPLFEIEETFVRKSLKHFKKNHA